MASQQSAGPMIWSTSAVATTTGATSPVLATMSVQDPGLQGVYDVEIRYVAQSGAAAGTSGSILYHAKFEYYAGTYTAGAITAVDKKLDSGFALPDLTLSAGAGGVGIVATGIAATTINHKCAYSLVGPAL